MAQTAKNIREAYNKKTYKQYKFRVRKDSELHCWLENYMADGNVLNELVVDQLTSRYERLKETGFEE